MRLRPVVFALSAALLLASATASADTRPSAWTFDPQVLLARSEAVIVRTPDATLDRLFQAVADAARRPRELQAMCALFEPDARRDLAALNQAALRFDPDSQRSFQRATESVLQASRDAPAQPYDPQLAQRALRQAAVASAMLYDGFVAAINSPHGDPASRQARCRALRQLLDTVSMRPLRERAMITRLMMREGLRRIER